MSKNLGRIAYTLALVGLKRDSGGGSETPGTGESVFEYVQKNSIFSGSQAQFNEAWKSSLSPKPFKDQFFSYLTSIGYNQTTMDNADKYILQLVNGEIKPTESFYDSMKKLVPHMSETEINTIMKQLLNGTLTMEQFYSNLKDLNYGKSFDSMQLRIIELFTKDFIDQDTFNTTVKDLEDKINSNSSNPFEYLKSIDNTVTDADKPKFDENFINMANNTTFYKYMESLLPSATESQVDKVMLDLISGKLYNKSIYQEMQNYGYEGSEQEMAQWLLALVRGEIKDPWTYAQELGGTSKDTFDYFYNEFLNNGLVNADGGDSYPGSWEIQPIEPGDNFNIYNFYKSLGFSGSQQELYEQLLTLANGLLTGGSASDDIYDLGKDSYPGMWNDNSTEPVNYQTVYDWFKSAGYTGTESELKIQMNNIANLIISGTINGGSSDSWPGNDKYEGSWVDGNSPIPVSNDFYDYMKSIGYKEDKNTLDNQILNLCNQLITGYVSGGNSSDTSGMNLDDAYNGEWDIKSGSSCNCITPDVITGGSAMGLSENPELFEGSWNKNDFSVTDNFYNYMKTNANYPYSKEVLNSQLAELFNKLDNAVSIDAGGAEFVDNTSGESYDGPLPEIRNALIDYLISQGWEDTPENEALFNYRFKEFAEGKLSATTLDGN